MGGGGGSEEAVPTRNVDDDIVVNPVECLAKTAVDSLWLLSIFLWMNGPT